MLFCSPPQVQTLRHIDVTNNHSLSMIPNSSKGNSESILFIMNIHRFVTVTHIADAFCWSIATCCLMRRRSGEGWR